MDERCVAPAHVVHLLHQKFPCGARTLPESQGPPLILRTQQWEMPGRITDVYFITKPILKTLFWGISLQKKILVVFLLKYRSLYRTFVYVYL